uniref:Secreted protein n=1 Tax=Angiostrongylus cantonensis TaxID=6313 RepID=A0A0K0DIP4_ANGCA
MTSSTVGLSLALCVMFLLTEAYPSSKESQRHLVDVFNCIRRQVLAVGKMYKKIRDEFTGAELMAECSRILGQFSTREMRCVFSPIRCLFRPTDQPHDDNDGNRR